MVLQGFDYWKPSECHCEKITKYIKKQRIATSKCFTNQYPDKTKITKCTE